MIDQLSGGRYQIGIGRGTTGGAEFEMWGGDPSETDARFEESFAVLFRGLRSQFLSHHGDFFNFDNLFMPLRPYQQPHPPFWYAGNPKRAPAWGHELSRRRPPCQARARPAPGIFLRGSLPPFVRHSPRLRRHPAR